MNQLLAINFAPLRLFAIGGLALATIISSEVLASAQAKQNSIGPTISFGSESSTFGVQGKLHLTENILQAKNNISLRPFVRLPSHGVDVGASVTYDFEIPQYSYITPYAGIGLASLNGISTTPGFFGAPPTTASFNQVAFYGQAGFEINASQNLSLSSHIQVPFNNKLSANFTMGANYRF